MAVLFFAPACAGFIGFPNKTEYVYCCLIFLVFDTISILPYAKLRFEEKPMSFAAVKLINIFVNVSLNLYLLTNTPDFLKEYSQVTLILIAFTFLETKAMKKNDARNANDGLIYLRAIRNIFIETIANKN